jgi:hypothetical protein
LLENFSHGNPRTNDPKIKLQGKTQEVVSGGSQGEAINSSWYDFVSKTKQNKLNLHIHGILISFWII